MAQTRFPVLFKFAMLSTFPLLFLLTPLDSWLARRQKRQPRCVPSVVCSPTPSTQLSRSLAWCCAEDTVSAPRPWQGEVSMSPTSSYHGRQASLAAWGWGGGFGLGSERSLTPSKTPRNARRDLKSC